MRGIGYPIAMPRQRRVYEQRLGGGEGAVFPVHMPP